VGGAAAEGPRARVEDAAALGDELRVELAALVGGVQPTAIVTDAEVAATFAAAIPIARSQWADGVEVLLPAHPADPGRFAPAAVLKFSSGSTAEPKGVALTAANVIAEAENVTSTLELGPGDRVLAAVPVFHSYGFDLGLLQTLYAGSTLVLTDVLAPRWVVATLADDGVSAFLGVPALYRAILASSISAPADLSHVRWLLSCTAPLGEDVITAFEARFHAPICQHYGSSEAGAVTNHVPAEILRRPSSVGRPVNGVDVFVAGHEGERLPPGSEGEVVAASAAVARAYALGAPGGISPLRDGAFWTGDLGVLDGDGFLTLSGRRDALINVGGLKVSPVEVRTVLERHFAVREAAVIGIPDAIGGEVVYAVVELRAQASESELLRFCRAALAEHKVPRRIEIRDTLPRTASGKVRLRLDDLAL
jgi:long-chain acyl-CoA synthetase